MTVSVVLVDDHQAVRDGLRAALAHSSEFLVAGEAGDGCEAVALCERLQPDLVVMDISLPDTSGITLTPEILRVCPHTKVVFFSIYDDEDSIVAAIRAGARGFVLKKAPAREVLNALRKVAGGGTFLSQSASGPLIELLQRPPDASEPAADVDSLSPRELQVLRLVAGGKRTKEVAVELNLEHNTVRSYRKTMMKKLGVSNLAELRQAARTSGLLPSLLPRNRR